MFTKALLAATVITAATAQVPAIAQRDFIIIERRQDDALNIDPQCSSALAAVSTLYDTLPTPAADLLSASVTLPTDPCATPSFTGKLESEWVSYTSAALGWYSANSGALNSFITACSGLVDDSATGLPVCSTDLPGAGAATTTAAVTTTAASAGQTSASAGNTSSPTATGASTSASAAGSPSAAQSSAASSTASTGAAPRETGFVVAAAVAAAGLLGAVAAL
ncbi:hypothetical protein F4825DRAFT_413346 [Nemania diffusa]|nr:hypothetical protein F4825DRAFT_413346 [Nemania diffusa]